MEKQRWEESEKRREEKKREEKREEKESEEQRCRCAKHSVFPMICGSGVP
jgi:hypothetical protein